MVPDSFQQVGQDVVFLLTMEPVVQAPVGGDADGFVFGSVVNEFGMLVPVGLPETEPIHRAARRPVPFQVSNRSLRVAVLEGVESALFASLEQFHDSFRRVPGGHVAVEVLVEMRVTIDGIATDD